MLPRIPVTAAPSTTKYSGWGIPSGERKRLLAMFPPTHPRVIADHVTLDVGVTPDTPLPAGTSGEIVGMVDHAGIQILVFEIAGSLKRPNGQHYHATWSIEPDIRSQESNTVLDTHGFQKLHPVRVTLKPKLFGF